MYLNIVLSILLIGLSCVIIGVVINKYPKRGRFKNIRKELNLLELSHYGIIGKLIDLLIGDKNSSISKWISGFCKKYESIIHERVLVMLKLTIPIVLVIIYLSVYITNLNNDVENTKKDLSQSAYFMLLGDSKTSGNENAELYESIINGLGEDVLKNLTDEKRKEMVREYLPKIHNGTSIEINELTERFNNTFKNVQLMKSMNLSVIIYIFILILLGLFLPESYVLFVYFVNRAKIEKEVIKLENLFSLLADIPGFKTDAILKEMEKSTKLFIKKFNICNKTFLSDKKSALTDLYNSVSNKRFKNLIMIIEKYCLADKSSALDIMERQIKENNDKTLLLANERIDVLEIIALFCIAPQMFLSFFIIIKPLFDVSMKALSSYSF